MNDLERPEIRLNDQNWVQTQKYIGKQLMAKGVDTAVLPGGIAIDASAFRGFKHSANVKTYVMSSPEQLLKDPNPNCKYVWRPRTDPKHSTEGLCRTGQIQAVEFDRIDHNSPSAAEVYEYAGAGSADEITGFVACGDMGLYEVTPKKTYEWFEQPVDATFAALAGLKPRLEDASQEYGRRHGFNVKSSNITVSETQDVATERRRPITS